MPAGSARLALTLLIFALTLLAVLTRPRGLPEAVATVTGAILLLAAGLVPPLQAVHVLLAAWNILLFFAGLVLVAWAAEQSGFFRWTALCAARLARGSPQRMLLNVLGLGILMTTALSNDATALLLTPVVVTLAETTELPPLPFALACAFIANTASVTLPVSNPINVLFLEDFRGIHLGAYLGHLLAPSLAAIGINVLGLWLLLRGRLGNGLAGKALPRPESAVISRSYFRYTVVCLAAIAAAYIAVSLRGGPLSLVAIAGAAALLGGGLVSGHLPLTRLRRAPWTIVPFVAGLLVLVQGLENAGVTGWLGLRLVAASDSGRLSGVFAATLGSALGANAINNLPMATVLAASIRHARVQPLALRRGLVYGAIFGCDVGPNLTVFGSLSTMLWLVLMRGRGVQVTGWQYVRTGLIVAPPMLLIGALLIAAVR